MNVACQLRWCFLSAFMNIKPINPACRPALKAEMEKQNNFAQAVVTFSHCSRAPSSSLSVQSSQMAAQFSLFVCALAGVLICVFCFLFFFFHVPVHF